MHAATASSSTLPPYGAPPRSPLGPRKPQGVPRSASDRSIRNGATSGEASPTRSASTPNPSVRRSASATSAVAGGSSSLKDAKAPSKKRSTADTGTPGPGERYRATPRLPHDKNAKPVPATLMHWSPAPVYGYLPTRGMRAHTVTMVDNVAWVFGGCDDKGCWQDVWCFDVETMFWSHPQMLGDIPPPCRAHSATLVDRKIVIFGGGQGPQYYNDVYVLDTVTRRWTKPVFSHPIPAPRRAHTTVHHKNKLWIFGGGNGMEALNDVWTLDVGVPIDRMRWELIETGPKKPSPRGYHTANLIGNVMVVIGGSDGRECFSDVWLFNIDTLGWLNVKLEVAHRRLSHSSTQIGSYLFITGGHDGTNYTSELLLFNLVSLQYEARQTVGKRPSPRGYHVAVLADGRLFVFGGFNGHEVYDDVHILDLAAAAYLPQVTSFRIEMDLL
ncbi:galactose oxidase [Punctularia strigosozonata HHB-11173 SS5]|uniref:galactose oxidase n=1 Tax=Punctularia strigosozonata (strain HHB-11173) TaxID=741275 RepID=UPI0004418194|nr:galactose oxidase [Punctularia strigosozonata HHB-11173 SS5]EIN05797.1 galactose oxidase [Punctularia strigosozonata HHB-11173 SS5]